MNYSLRQLLLVSLLSASMLIWGIAAYVNYRVTRDEVANLFDAELAQSAKVLNAFVESLLREGSLSGRWSQEQEKADELLHTYNLKRKFKVKALFSYGLRMMVYCFVQKMRLRFRFMALVNPILMISYGPYLMIFYKRML